MSQDVSSPLEGAYSDEMKDSIEDRKGVVEEEMLLTILSTECLSNENFSSTSRKKQKKTQLSKCNVRKRLRESGKKEVQARVLKSPCNNCFLKCVNIFAYNDRMQIHKSFWNMSNDEKTKFYFKFVKRQPVKRRRSNSDHKQFTFCYYFEKDMSTYRVCRTFFLNTLCIDQKRIYYFFEHLNDANMVLPLPTKKVKNVIPVKPLENFSEVSALTSSSPTIDSHCCRSNAQTEYIDDSPDLKIEYPEDVSSPQKSPLEYAYSDEIKYFIEDVIDDNNVMVEGETLCKQLPSECASSLPNMEDNNEIFSSTSKKRQKKAKISKSKLKKRLQKSGKACVSINKKEVPARVLKSPCNNCFFKCVNLFSYNDRMQIHKSFWNMSNDEKTNFYLKFVKRQPVKRRRSNSDLKQFSFFYYFEKNTSTHRVCRTFFTNTLCIDQKRIYYCFEHLNDANMVLQLPTKKGKNVKPVIPVDIFSKVSARTSSSPTIDSHHCRSNVQTEYITDLPDIKSEYPGDVSSPQKTPLEYEYSNEIKYAIEDVIEDDNVLVEDKTLLKKLPSECVSSLPNKQDNNRFFSSTSKKKKQKKVQRSKCKVRKRLQKPDKTYVSLKKKEIPIGVLKSPCNNCFHKCVSIFSYDDRMQIHKSFWNMSNDEKISFYFKFVKRQPVKRRRTKSHLKQFTFVYYFEKDTSTHRVCRTFFLNTLCIDQKRIYYCFEHFNDPNMVHSLPTKKIKNVKPVIPLEIFSVVSSRTTSSPTIDSHYCPSNAQTEYITDLPVLKSEYPEEVFSPPKSPLEYVCSDEIKYNFIEDSNMLVKDEMLLKKLPSECASNLPNMENNNMYKHMNNSI